MLQRHHLFKALIFFLLAYVFFFLVWGEKKSQTNFTEDHLVNYLKKIEERWKGLEKKLEQHSKNGEKASEEEIRKEISFLKDLFQSGKSLQDSSAPTSSTPARFSTPTSPSSSSLFTAKPNGLQSVKETTWRCYKLNQEDGSILEVKDPFYTRGLSGIVCHFRHLCFWDGRFHAILKKGNQRLHGKKYILWPAHSTRKKENETDEFSDAAMTVEYRPDPSAFFSDQQMKINWFLGWTWAIEHTYLGNIWHWWEWMTTVFAARTRMANTFPVVQQMLFSTHYRPSGMIAKFMLGVLRLAVVQEIPEHTYFSDDSLVKNFTEKNPLCFENAAIPGNGVYFLAPVDVDVWRQNLEKQYALSYPTAAASSANQKKAGLPPFKLIYVPRKQIRLILNEDELFDFLSAHSIPFHTLQMENATFGDQVKTIAASGVMLAVHGAGVTNSLFLPEGSAFIELLPYKYELQYWKTPSANLKLHYFHWMNTHLNNTKFNYPYDFSLDHHPAFSEICSGAKNGATCLMPRQYSNMRIEMKEVGPIILAAFEKIGYPIKFNENWRSVRKSS